MLISSPSHPHPHPHPTFPLELLSDLASDQTVLTGTLYLIPLTANILLQVPTPGKSISILVPFVNDEHSTAIVQLD